jgi:hypothetical protein
MKRLIDINMKSASMTFKQINFGLMDAESEKAQSPELLLEGFFDAFGYIDQITSGNKFYIFGQKGSGKSAIGSRIELIAKNDPNFFVNQHYLGRFEYKKFSELFPGSEAPESRYPTHWEFVLLISLLNNLKKDIQCEYESDSDFYFLVEILDQINVIPDKDFAEIVKNTSKKQFDIKFFKAENITEKETKLITINVIFNKLKNVCYTAKTPNKHLIVIDGLDVVLTHRHKQYQTLSALLIAVNNFNNKLKENNVNAKIVVLCRTDLLNKIADPNANKFIQNFGIFLNWYQDKKDIHSTNLVKLINRRVKLALKKEADISEFLPPSTDKDREILKLLLDHTRHIPRDLIQLLNKIQYHTSDKNPTKKDVENGIDEYSNVYFVRELQDTLVGFLDDEEKGERIIQLLGSMGKTQFSYREISEKIDSDQRFLKIDLTKTMDLLFDCSAIGNVNPRTGYNTWKYRNMYALFDPNQIIVIHKGLHKALNLRYERSVF